MFLGYPLLDKYFPPPEVGFTSNTDEPPPSIPPPIASLSVLSPVLPPPPAPSVLPPSQMPTASSGKSAIIAMDYEYHCC